MNKLGLVVTFAACGKSPDVQRQSATVQPAPVVVHERAPSVQPIAPDAGAATVGADDNPFDHPFTDDERRIVAVNLTKFFRDNDANVGFEARGRVLFVSNLEGGNCDRRALQAFSELPQMKDGLIGAGFERVRCTVDGAELRLKAPSKPESRALASQPAPAIAPEQTKTVDARADWLERASSQYSKAGRKTVRLSAGSDPGVLVIEIDGCGQEMLAGFRPLILDHAMHFGFDRLQCSDGSATAFLGD